MKHHIAICKCKSSDHLVEFVYDPEEQELYTTVQLHQHRNFISRVLTAILYIFGHKSTYGHWDCTLFDSDEANKLYHFLKRHKDDLK